MDALLFEVVTVRFLVFTGAAFLAAYVLGAIVAALLRK